MSTLSLMITIAARNRLPEFISAYQTHGVSVSVIALGHGTASSELLDFFGMESAEKAVCFSFVTEQTWRAVRRTLERQIRIDVPGTGIAFLVPLSCIGGKRELLFLTDGQEFEKGEESELKGTAHELLVAITNQGCSDLVMDAAKEAGAAGGTVIHARGTGMERAEKFLGISLASEKDIIFIVTRSAERQAIMQSVMRKAGMETRAKTIVFSLPVTSTAGLRLLELEEPPEEASGEAPAEEKRSVPT